MNYILLKDHFHATKGDKFVPTIDKWHYGITHRKGKFSAEVSYPYSEVEKNPDLFMPESLWETLTEEQQYAALNLSSAIKKDSATMDTYILQKDISTPQWFIKAGAEFEKYSESLDAAFVCGNYTLSPYYVIDNPEWFKKKDLFTPQEIVNDYVSEKPNMLAADEVMPKSKIDILFESRKEEIRTDGIYYTFSLDTDLKTVPAYTISKFQWDWWHGKSVKMKSDLFPDFERRNFEAYVKSFSTPAIEGKEELHLDFKEGVTTNAGSHLDQYLSGFISEEAWRKSRIIGLQVEIEKREFSDSVELVQEWLQHVNWLTEREKSKG